jgi:hypothetical protein
MRRQLEALLAQLPASPFARAGVVLAILVGGIVAVSVPVFFGLMLVAMMRGG